MKRVAPLVAVAAAALVAGCGSSSLSASQLRSQAGQVCALAGHQAEQIKDPAALGGGVVFLRDGIAVLTPELRQLQKLTPSQASERSYATALGAFSGELHDLTTTVRGLDKGDDPVDSSITWRRYRRVRTWPGVRSEFRPASPSKGTERIHEAGGDAEGAHWWARALGISHHCDGSYFAFLVLAAGQLTVTLSVHDV
jgi:hypothetical protein